MYPGAKQATATLMANQQGGGNWCGPGLQPQMGYGCGQGGMQHGMMGAMGTGGLGGGMTAGQIQQGMGTGGKEVDRWRLEAL